MLLIPSRRIWTQQPQQAVSIDTFWLSRGLAFVHNPAVGDSNLVRSALPLNSTGLPKDVGASGRRFNGSGVSYAECTDNGLASAGNALTLLSIWRAKDSQYLSSDGTRLLLSTRTAANAGWGWGRSSAIAGGSTGNLTSQTFVVNGVAQYFESNYKIASLVDAVVAFRASGTTASWFLAGEKSSSDTIIGSVSTGGNLVFAAGGPYSGPGTIWNDRAYLTVAFKEALSDSEIAALSANLWQVFKASDTRIWVPVSSGGGITIAPGSGHYVLAGKTASVTQPNAVAPSAAHVALAGHAPTVSQSAAIVVTPGAGHVALTGSVPGISQPCTIAPSVGHALLAGKTPIIVQAITLAPGSGHAVVAGKSPGVSQSSGMTLFPGIAHAVLAGKTPGIAQPNNIAPNTGHAVFAGKAPAVDSSAPLTDAEKIALILQILENRQTLNPVTGLFTLYADDGTTVLKTAQAWEDTAATIPYRGQGLQRLDALQ